MVSSHLVPCRAGRTGSGTGRAGAQCQVYCAGARYGACRQAPGRTHTRTHTHTHTHTQHSTHLQGLAEAVAPVLRLDAPGAVQAGLLGHAPEQGVHAALPGLQQGLRCLPAAARAPHLAEAIRRSVVPKHHLGAVGRGPLKLPRGWVREGAAGRGIRKRAWCTRLSLRVRTSRHARARARACTHANARTHARTHETRMHARTHARDTRALTQHSAALTLAAASAGAGPSSNRCSSTGGSAGCVLPPSRSWALGLRSM
jgi:hypothetical protein